MSRYKLRKGQTVKFHAHRKNKNGIIPEFQIGNQVFALQPVDSMQTAKWFHKMLRKAFKVLKNA